MAKSKIIVRKPKYSNMKTRVILNPGTDMQYVVQSSKRGTLSFTFNNINSPTPYAVSVYSPHRITYTTVGIMFPKKISSVTVKSMKPLIKL